MFEDIHRIDSTIFKPQQAGSKQRYQGNPKKRREASAEADNNRIDQDQDDDLTPASESGAEPHSLDIQA